MDKRRFISLFNNHQLELATFISKYIPEAAECKIAIVYDPALEDNNCRFKISLGNPLISTEKYKIYNSFLDLDNDVQYKRSIKTMKRDLESFASSLNNITAAEFAEERVSKYENIIEGYNREIDRVKYKVMQLNGETIRRSKHYWEELEKCERSITAYESKINEVGQMIDEFRNNLEEYISIHDKQVKFINKFMKDFTKYADKTLKEKKASVSRLPKRVQIAIDSKEEFEEIDNKIDSLVQDLGEDIKEIDQQLNDLIKTQVKGSRLKKK